ncbi:hypothetical protein [Listeria rocourtiae]
MKEIVELTNISQATLYRKLKTVKSHE